MQLPFAGLILLAGCFSAPPVPALTTQGEVRGTLGGSVSVPCQYQKVYQGNPKYWCRGAEWSTCSKVIETAGLEAEVKRGSVSIRDNHTLNTFTVTMENLTLGDAGTYWCGINKSGRDPNSRVNMMVLPALSTAVMVTTGSLSTANMTEHPKSSSPPRSVLLLPLLLLTLVVLPIVAILLAGSVMLKRKEAAGAGGRTPAVNEAVASTSTEVDVSYAIVKPKPRKSTSAAPSPHSAQAEHSPEMVEYSAVAPGGTNISHATMKYPILDEQADYVNMDRPSDQSPLSRLDQTDYRKLRKKQATSGTGPFSKA
ncbi:uncharacterized protein LOC112543595 isoform X2 [Pelodiscus sinensis]|uniref:uncharacterized protein LOC112543595 isoform X2 n=1 Tax=Pelodiscus sinensis TaxID=13735 RepID=UPI003F6B78CD